MPMYTTCNTASKNKNAMRLFLEAGLTVPTLAGASGRTTERRERSYDLRLEEEQVTQYMGQTEEH